MDVTFVGTELPQDKTLVWYLVQYCQTWCTINQLRTDSCGSDHLKTGPFQIQTFLFGFQMVFRSPQQKIVFRSWRVTGLNNANKEKNKVKFQNFVFICLNVKCETTYTKYYTDCFIWQSRKRKFINIYTVKNLAVV